MISVSNSVAPAVRTLAGELSEPAGGAVTHTVGAPSGGASDPLAAFEARHGMHPAVQRFAYAGPNGAGAGSTKTPPPPAYDVATMKQADIDKLKHADIPQGDIDKLKHSDVGDAELKRLAGSPNKARRERADAIVQDRQQAAEIERDRRFACTIENARVGYADLIAQHAKVVVTTSAGNGGQPVLVITGPDFKPAATTTVHTHYHGDNATVADPLGSKAGTNWRIHEALEQHPNTVFVLPESMNAPQGTDATKVVDSAQNDGGNDYHVNWHNVSDQAQTTDDALQAVGIAKIPDKVTEVVSFHSGGGKVVRELMKHDESGAGLRADRIELHDSLYGTKGHDWSKGPDNAGWESYIVAWAKTPNGKVADQAVYYHAGNEAHRQDVIAKAFAGRYTKVEMAEKGPIDPKLNPEYHDANGKAYQRSYHHKSEDGTRKWVTHGPVQMFDKDSHYRTTGQFLAADPPPKGAKK
jgi:hypothetical protein